jgi:hypothetical protein
MSRGRRKKKMTTDISKEMRAMKVQIVGTQG